VLMMVYGLLRLGAGLWVMMAVGCLTLMAYGQAKPAVDELAMPDIGLTLCDGIPCFRGLTPERTRWSEAVSALGSRSTVLDDPFYIKISLFPASEGELLDAIFLDHPLDRNVTVGAIMNRYGVPLCAETYAQAGTMILHYEGLHVLARARGGRFSPHTQVIAITVGALTDQAFCDATDSRNRQVIRHPWQGFILVQPFANEH
jgi:hypothetical protein